MVLFYDGIKKNIQPINLRPVPLEQKQQVVQLLFLSSLPVHIGLPGHFDELFTLSVTTRVAAWSCGEDCT